MKQYSGYEDILEDVCDKVYGYKEFGSYQGDWLAYVRYKGKDVWIKGSYGSCSGCDWFQAVEKYPWEWDYEGNEVEYLKRVEAESVRLRDLFVNEYLEEDMLFTAGQLYEKLKEDRGWDWDADKMLAYIDGFHPELANSNLRPCSCGGEAEFRNIGPLVWVECKKCGRSTSTFTAKINAERVWNGEEEE